MSYPGWMEDAYLREPEDIEGFEEDMWDRADEERDRIKEGFYDD